MPEDLSPDTDTDIAIAKRDLAAAYRLIAHFGMDDGIYTHISMRIGHDR
ncbi:MAG: class II aldolase/adducin family protein, partial [Pseudomonadota bacterium]